ncbi:MAG: hypothetical protein M3440_05520 [Chloroflexota bacterium]|nr:hypothetical protein [Chloroflexota bacterium]
MISTTDPVFARRMLERAIAMQTKPTLDTAAVDDLMTIALSTGTGGDPILGSDLNKAASIGWQWKSSLTSDQYNLGGGAGKTLTRDQWFSHCMSLAAQYAIGAHGVIDGGASAVPGDTVGTVTTLHLNYLTDEYLYETTS